MEAVGTTRIRLHHELVDGLKKHHLEVDNSYQIHTTKTRMHAIGMGIITVESHLHYRVKA